MHGIRECGILELRRDLRQDRATPDHPQARALWTPPRKESMTDEESSREDVFCPHCGAISHTDCVLAEREACAQIADAVGVGEVGMDEFTDGSIDASLSIADAIRARGKR